jgi:hypothetical protein
MAETRALVSKLLEKIAGDGLSEAQLGSLYENATDYPEMDEGDRENLIAAIEDKLRSSFPKAAKRRFGPKDEFARNLLEPIFQKSVATFDLSGNKVLNKVKTGGDMMKGIAHVDVYISYKNVRKQRLSLNVRQETAESPPMVVVQTVAIGGGAAPTAHADYALAEFERAAKIYLHDLAEVVAVDRAG